MEVRRYACDACRRRRIRCEASQPCAQCVRNGLVCTYGSTSSRQSSTAYARNLEHQVAELQRQLQAFGQAVVPTASSSASSATTPHPEPAAVDSLVQSGSALVLPQANGKKVFRCSAALNVLRTIADMLVSEQAVTPLGKSLVEVMEMPTDLPTPAPMDWLHALLPSREHLWEKISRAIDIALVTHDCLSLPVLLARLDALYNEPRSINQSRSFLSLIYVLLALDDLYIGLPDGNAGADGAQSPRLCGLHYFRASRAIVRDDKFRIDLDGVTAIMFQAKYLLSASTFSEAHLTLMNAISAAMQLGLHLDDASLQESFTEAELYDRRRVFSVLYMMESYVAIVLGMPRTLRFAGPSQTLGLSRDDMRDQGISLITRDATTPQAETILNEKVVLIYAKILDRQSEQSVDTYADPAWMGEIDAELTQWEKLLPDITTGSLSERALQGQLSLRLNHTGAQILLYAPCLHHISRDRSDPAWNMTGYEYGSRCIRAASQSVFIMKMLQAYNLLNAIHWVNSYRLAWAATILAYFVTHSHTRVTIAESKRAALLADEMLQQLGETNIAAKRIHDCIAPSMEIIAAAPEE